MAKILKNHEAVTISNNGIHTALASGYKMAFVSVKLETESGETFEGITLNYNNYAQSFAVVVNDGNGLFGYALPVTTVAGLFANKEDFLFDDGTKFSSNSAVVSKFDNGKIFRNIKPFNSFSLVASASGQLIDRRKDKSKGKTPPTWTIWGVKAEDDRPTQNGTTITWGSFSIDIEEIAEKVAKSFDALCDRLNG